MMHLIRLFAVLGFIGIVRATDTSLTKIYFYYGKTLAEHVVYNLSDVNALLAHPRFRPNHTTSMYVHGFTESANEYTVHIPTMAYLNNGNHNTLVYDWGALAGHPYFKAVDHMEAVAKRMVDVLLSLFAAGLSLEKFHLVGHSLGGQMVGTIGHGIQVTTADKTILPRITALDPAGPLFWTVDGLNLLHRPITAKDAIFVDVIHTDAGVFGIGHSCGTVDFWPNAGKRVQPGCKKTPLIEELLHHDYCSHHRSWQYWSSSLEMASDESAFLSAKADDYGSFQAGKVHAEKFVSMGINCPTNVTGSYYLRTSEHKPYSLGAKGASYV